MTNVIQTVYPKDLTMKLASNHIEREIKEFDTAEDRIFVPDGGPFYSQSLILKDSNGKLLKPQVEYKLLYLNEQATLDSGRDVVSVIWIIPETITGVELDYRVVGGEYGNTVNAIMQEIHAAGPIQKNVDWNINVYSKPSQFPPAPHFHTPDTFTGWSMVYEQLEGIRKAIISGDEPSWEAHYNYINRLMYTIENNLNSKFSNYPTLNQMSAAINAIDFSVDLSGYYTKVQVNSIINAVDSDISDVASNLSLNYYTKAQGDSRYAKINDVYTKSQSDGKYGLINDYYTKSQSDGKYLTSSNLSGYYTTAAAGSLETRLNNKIDEVYDAIPDAPDLSNYYTKSQVYAKGEVYSKTETYTKTEVNTAISNIPTVNLSNYYTKSQSYSKTEVNNLVSDVFNNAPEVDLDDYYTKEQVEAMIAAAVSGLSSGSGSLSEVTINLSTGVTLTMTEGWSFSSFTPTSFSRKTQSTPPSGVRFYITLPIEYDPSKHKIDSSNPSFTVSGRQISWYLSYSSRTGWRTESGYGGERFPYTYWVMSQSISVKIVNK